MGGTILIVDDDERLLRVVGRMLSPDGGHGVVVANSAARALELVADWTFDMIVLDWGLPDGSGLELLSELRSRGILCPVLMLSGHDGLEERVEALEAGADDYVVKPFEPEELRARVNAHLRRASGAFGFDPNAAPLVACGELDTEGETDRAGLTPGEAAVLRCLAAAGAEPVPQERMLRQVFDIQSASDSRVALTVASMRRKLKRAGSTLRISLQWGRGYTLMRQ